MTSALRSIQQTDAGRWLLVPRLAAGASLLFAGLASWSNPTPLRTAFEATGVPLRHLLLQVTPALAVASGALLILGYFCRVGALLGVQITLSGLLAQAKLEEMNLVDATALAVVPPVTISLILLASALIVLWRGGGEWSLDAEDVSTSFGFGDGDDFTEFLVEDHERMTDAEAGLVGA